MDKEHEAFIAGLEILLSMCATGFDAKHSTLKHEVQVAQELAVVLEDLILEDGAILRGDHGWLIDFVKFDIELNHSVLEIVMVNLLLVTLFTVIGEGILG